MKAKKFGSDTQRENPTIQHKNWGVGTQNDSVASFQNVQRCYKSGERILIKASTGVERGPRHPHQALSLNREKNPNKVEQKKGNGAK
jgi:hypothetical protein